MSLRQLRASIPGYNGVGFDSLWASSMPSSMPSSMLFSKRTIRREVVHADERSRYAGVDISSTSQSTTQCGEAVFDEITTEIQTITISRSGSRNRILLGYLHKAEFAPPVHRGLGLGFAPPPMSPHTARKFLSAIHRHATSLHHSHVARSLAGTTRWYVRSLLAWRISANVLTRASAHLARPSRAVVAVGRVARYPRSCYNLPPKPTPEDIGFACAVVAGREEGNRTATGMAP